MKTNKKFQTMTNSELTKTATNEVKAINTNPRYLFRKLNKFATGKESDLSDLRKAQEVSTIGIAETYNRLEEAFGQGGFWWGSVMARNGYLLTSCREVKDDLDEGGSDFAPLYQRDGFVWTEKVNGKLYSFRVAAEWSEVNIIRSASMMLRFAEASAKASGQLYSWQQARKEAKSKASKKSKTSKKGSEKKQVVEGQLFKAIQEIQAKFAKGKMTKKQLDAELEKALSAAA